MSYNFHTFALYLVFYVCLIPIFSFVVVHVGHVLKAIINWNIFEVKIKKQTSKIK